VPGWPAHGVRDAIEWAQQGAWTSRQAHSSHAAGGRRVRARHAGAGAAHAPHGHAPPVAGAGQL